MTKKQINRDISRMMGENLKRLRMERGWTQEQLANLIETDRRYISAMESGRGIGRNLLDRLCRVFEVDELTFTRDEAQANREMVDELPQVTRMILHELKAMPEYDQLRLLAEIVERRVKNLQDHMK